jgi:hypothetical protein
MIPNPNHAMIDANRLLAQNEQNRRMMEAAQNDMNRLMEARHNLVAYQNGADDDDDDSDDDSDDNDNDGDTDGLNYSDDDDPLREVDDEE